MVRIIAIHEYELREGINHEEFERMLKEKLKDLNMEGLISKHTLKGYKGERKGKYAVLWIFESQEMLEKLFGTENEPLKGPPSFMAYENFLRKYIERDPTQITYTDYWDITH